MDRRILCVAALACGLTLSACGADSLTGGDDSETKNGKEAVAIVKKFAEASGPEACSLLTPNALRNVYGGEEAVGKPAVALDQPAPQYAVDNCLERSSKFEGEKVEIDKVDVIAERAVKVQTAIPGAGDEEERLYDVVLRRKGDQYLIDEVREK